MSDRQSCLYFGTVFHHRTRPKRHGLKYRVFALHADLDELPGLSDDLRLFAHNRLGLFSFLDRDHGSGGQTPLRVWVENALADAGIAPDGGAIRLLCYPRILGFVFNPLSVYYCHRRDGGLAAIIYEVNNTFGQRHCYVIPVEPEQTEGQAGERSREKRGEIRQVCDKHFYVSPFMAVSGRYHFRLDPPSEKVSVVINYTDEQGLLLHAAFAGARVELNDSTLLRAFFTYPLMTFKVVAGIHWEAAKLWRKRVPLIDRPAPPEQLLTIVRANEL